jgi:hypothetical protein
MSWGEHVPPNKVRAWDISNPRPRLGSPAPGEDGIWFSYDDGTPPERVAKRVIPYLAEAEEWWGSELKEQ